MEFIDNSSLSSSQFINVDLENKFAPVATVVRLNENILKDLNKRKRKLSTDSLDSLNENDSELTAISNTTNINSNTNISFNEKTLLDSKSSTSTVQQYLNDSGLDVQLINKNDKKLIKLNLNNNSFNSINFKINKLKTIIKTNSPSTLLNNKNIITTTIKTVNNNNNNLNEIDDLPSESDLINGTIIVPLNSSIKNTNNNSNKEIDCLNQNQVRINIENADTLNQQLIESNTVNVDDQNSNESNQSTKSKKNVNKSNKLTIKKASFICNECGIQVISQSDLNKHMLQFHELVKKYTCSQCELSFYELSAKNRHEKEHLGIKPFRCNICSFEFTRASNLRSHLLKVHSNEIGKLVHINKTIDNKLQFDFDMNAINVHKEKMRMLKFNGNCRSNLSLSKSPATSSAAVPTPSSNSNNAVIYIKDPNNKNADIQHMVVYVDGKPIFVENPKLKQQNSTNTTPSDDSPNSCVEKSHLLKPSTKATNNNNLSSVSTGNKPVAKIPYLLAAAAAAAANNQRNKQKSQTSLSIISNDCARSSCYLIPNTSSKLKDVKQDKDYNELVSMLRQKNEKLYNPLLNKSF